MSKLELKSFLKALKKNQLEAQIIDLYDRFKEVKVFYDFSFRPDEEKLLEEAKFKIKKEYFPDTYRRPKARRSIAQKLIKHFQTLEVDPAVVANLMLYHVQLGVDFNKARAGISQAAQKSFGVSFRQLVQYARKNALYLQLLPQFTTIADRVWRENWHNAEIFSLALEGNFVSQN